MVLDYLQIPIKYDNLIRLLGVDAIGTPFRRLQNLKTLGLNIHIDEGGLPALQTYLEAGLPSREGLSFRCHQISMIGMLLMRSSQFKIS
jgi:hypothetical protein